jgi:hypothetical protein
MIKKLQNTAAFVFIACVVVLSIVSILGIWKIFSDDVITKSFQTMGLLGGVAIIIIAAGRFVDSRQENVAPVPGVTDVSVAPNINPAFTSIRHVTLATLIASVAILALIGVLSIWDVISGTMVNKSASSIGVLAFSSLIIVITCLEREQHRLMRQKISGGMALIAIIVLWTLWSLVF